MKNVIIIGAGPAGLTAAYELLSAGDYKVTILEESDTIGGISQTVNYKGNRMDLGGHRFFSKDPKVNAWWSRLLPLQGSPSRDDLLLDRKTECAKEGSDPETEDRVMLKRKRVSRIFYKHKFFDYPISLKKETIINMGFLTTCRAGCSYLFSCIYKRKEINLENFYINRFGKVLYSMFFEGYTEKLWGRHPRDISADWGAQRVKGLSILVILKNMFQNAFAKTENKNGKVETSLIEEFIYPKFGPGQLWETAAGEIEAMGGEIYKNCRVVTLDNENNHIHAVEYESKGSLHRMEADIILSSMPLKDLIAGMRNIPKEIRTIASGLPYRDFVTVGLLVDKLNLKNETSMKTVQNRIPDCWIYVQDTGVKLGRIQIFNNWSPYMVKDYENTVWIGLEYFCKEKDPFWSMAEEDCIDMAIRELITMGVIDSKEAVKDTHRIRVKKAYPAYFDTYRDIDRLITHLNSYENLFCIGRNGQHRYNNMDHSMITAFEAVKNITNRKTGKDNIWKVNTEQDYHEEN